MLNSPPFRDRDEADDREMSGIVRAGPSGALTVAGIATVVVVACWLAFYLFVFLPRGG